MLKNVDEILCENRENLFLMKTPSKKKWRNIQKTTYIYM